MAAKYFTLASSAFEVNYKLHDVWAHAIGDTGYVLFTFLMIKVLL